MQKSLTRNDILDSWRGILCLWVVLSHIFSSFKVNLFILSAPGYAVDGFVFLSGYFIRQSCQKYQRNSGFLKPYFIARFMRIWPTYAIIFSFCFIVNLLLGLSNYESINFALTVFFTNLFLLNGFFTNLISSFIIPSWSLCLEMQFYLFFPLIYLFRLDTNWVFIFILFLITYFSPYFFVNQFHFGYYFNFGLPSILPLRIFHFILGVLWLNYTNVNDYFKILFPISLLIFLINPFTAILFALIYLSSYLKSNIIDRLIIIDLLSFVGKISFSLYLIHNPILFYCNSILNDPFFYNLPYKFLTTLILVLGISILLSYFFYHYFEIKFIEIGRKWITKTNGA